jgi:hypothetical protein
MKKPAKTTRAPAKPKAPIASKSTSIPNPIREKLAATIAKPKRSRTLKRLIGNKKLCYYLETEELNEVMRLRYSALFENEDDAIEAQCHDKIQWQPWYIPN